MQKNAKKKKKNSNKKKKKKKRNKEKIRTKKLTLSQEGPSTMTNNFHQA